MKTIKILLGFLPGVTLGMWLRAMWFWFAVCICNPSDDTPLWFVAVLLMNVVVAGCAIAYFDNKKWKEVSNHLNQI